MASSRPPQPKLTWLHARDVTAPSAPQLFLSDTAVSPHRIEQGRLGDCFFVAALQLVARQPSLVHALFTDPSVDLTADDASVTCRFFRDGEWVESTVDCVLPCSSRRSSSQQLAFARSTDPGELWVSVLEKAYALSFAVGRPAGEAYALLYGGNLSEALVDLTGAPCEDWNLDRMSEPESRQLFDRLRAGLSAGRLLGCASTVPPGEEVEVEGNGGIYHNHAYAVEDVHVERKRRYVRLRNPLGERGISFHKPRTPKSLSDPPQAGEFWMTWSQFTSHFNRVYECKLDVVGTETGLPVRRLEGAWCGEAGTAGGVDSATFHRNPVLVLDVDEPCRLVALLQQEDARGSLKAEGKSMNYHQVGMTLVRLGDSPFPSTDVRDCVHKTSFWNKRDMSLEVEHLESGRYALVPSTFYAGDTGRFVLSVFCSAQSVLDSATPRLDTSWLGALPLHLSASSMWSVKRKTAGGRSKFPTFSKNPAFMLELPPDSGAPVQIVVALEQKKTKTHKKPHGAAVYVLKRGDLGLSRSPSPVPTFTNLWVVSRAVTLDPAEGPFLLIPCTFEARKASKFTLHVVAQQPVDMVLSPTTPKLRETKPKKTRKGKGRKPTTTTFAQAKQANASIADLYSGLE